MNVYEQVVIMLSDLLICKSHVLAKDLNLLEG
jgi:hypothetical protein